MDPFLILAVAVINFFVAFIAASVGGSGLVITPVLLSLGVPAPSAVAAKRFSNIGLTSISLLKFHREGKVIWRIGVPMIAVSVAAAYIAANIVLTMDEVALSRVIGAVIIGTILFMLINKKFGLEERARNMKKRNKALGGVFFFAAVFVSHISGGGGGIFTSHVLIFFFGMTFLQAAGTRKISGVVSTSVAVLVYILAGVIPFDIAIPLLVAGTAGGWFGSHYAIRKGDAWVRRLFMIVISILGIKLILFPA